MSRTEKFLWGADFMISGIGWHFGGPYAGLACFAIGAILILFGLTENARPRWRRAVFETVENIRKALGIESTWRFVLVVALGFACTGAIIGGGMAWLADRIYKHSPEYRADHPDPKPQTVTTIASNSASQNVTVRGGSSQGLQNVTPAQSPGSKKKWKRVAQAALREKLPSQDVKPIPSPPVQPPMSQECDNGAYCAQSTGQSGGFTGQVIITPKPPLPNINWTPTAVKPAEYPELQRVPGYTMGSDPEAEEKQRLQKENTGVVVTLTIDRSWSDAMFAAICNTPCKTIKAVTVDGNSMIGDFTPQPAANVVAIGVQIPATLEANFPVKWEIRSQSTWPLTIVKVMRAVHKEPN